VTGKISDEAMLDALAMLRAAVTANAARPGGDVYALRVVAEHLADPTGTATVLAGLLISYMDTIGEDDPLARLTEWQAGIFPAE
jgi:hypothetical protein